MEEVGVPKKQSVALLFILTLITLGLYGIIWYIIKVKSFNNLQTKTKLSKSLPVILIFTWIIILALSGTAYYFTSTSTSGTVSSISEIPQNIQIIYISLISIVFIHIILIIITSFRYRKILNEALINKGSRIKLSGFYTFFFNFLYLQYEINRIVDDKEENKRTAPLICFLLLYIVLPLIPLIILLLITLGVIASFSFS